MAKTKTGIVCDTLGHTNWVFFPSSDMKLMTSRRTRSFLVLKLTPGQVIYSIPRVKSKRQTEGIQGQSVHLRVFPRLMIMLIRPCLLLIRSALSQDLFKGADVHIQTRAP